MDADIAALDRDEGRADGSASKRLNAAPGSIGATGHSARKGALRMCSVLSRNGVTWTVSGRAPTWGKWASRWPLPVAMIVLVPFWELKLMSGGAGE